MKGICCILVILIHAPFTNKLGDVIQRFKYSAIIYIIIIEAIKPILVKLNLGELINGYIFPLMVIGIIVVFVCICECVTKLYLKIRAYDNRRNL